MAAVPFHLHPAKDALLARAPELAAAVMERSARDGKVWSEIMDVEAAIGVFRMLGEQEQVGDIRAAIVGGSHFFAYSLGCLWFMPTVPLVIEQFFMRIDRGSTAAALHDIEDLGRSAGARGVLMATSLAANDAALGRLLARHGYSPQSSQHLKAI